MNGPTLWIIAGPNGVGKTTYAFRHIAAVAQSADFINLDEIARGLSPLAPAAKTRRAARVALEMTGEALAAGRTFSMETTLAGQTHLGTAARARAAGFAVHLLYFSVAEVETCLARIARRVSEGGHTVPEADVRRRFERSARNFPAYAAQARLWRVFDANGAAPRVVAEGRGDCIALRPGAEARLPAPLSAALASMPDCREG